MRCSFEFGGMTIQNDPSLNWGFFGFILAVSDDLDIHFQTICLPLTLYSMRLALSLLAFSSLAAAQSAARSQKRGRLGQLASSPTAATENMGKFGFGFIMRIRALDALGYWHCFRERDMMIDKSRWVVSSRRQHSLHHSYFIYEDAATGLLNSRVQ